MDSILIHKLVTPQRLPHTIVESGKFQYQNLVGCEVSFSQLAIDENHLGRESCDRGIVFVRFADGSVCGDIFLLGD